MFGTWHNKGVVDVDRLKSKYDLDFNRHMFIPSKGMNIDVKSIEDISIVKISENNFIFNIKRIGFYKDTIIKYKNRDQVKYLYQLLATLIKKEYNIDELNATLFS